jgi:hypothetical protein
MKSGGKLARYTSLRRFARVPRVRTEPRRSSRERDPEYMERVRQLPCAAQFLHECYGAIHAHHAGERGLGQKADDHTSIPLCLEAHSNWHDANGCFRGWTKEQRAEWATQMIAITQHVLGYRKPEEAL